MFPLDRFLTGEQNDCVKVENNIWLIWKPAPGIQIVAMDVKYFRLQFPSNPCLKKIGAGAPQPPPLPK